MRSFAWRCGNRHPLQAAVFHSPLKMKEAVWSLRRTISYLTLHTGELPPYQREEAWRRPHTVHILIVFFTFMPVRRTAEEVSKHKSRSRMGKCPRAMVREASASEALYVASLSLRAFFSSL